MLIRALPAPLLLATLLVACQAAPSATPLAGAQQRWVEQGLTQYRYQARQQCYCGAPALQPASVQVSGNHARLETPDPTGALTPLVRTIEAWFALIEEKQRNGWHQVDVEYHPQLGYPVHIQLDFDPRMADDEQEYWIDHLTPVH
ncbi:MAG: DUF6174 domain-containing protein [Pseudomonadota bacterium]|nr:DUF6174 domain-containing protein [Pseudomonadota bacterium]